MMIFVDTEFIQTDGDLCHISIGLVTDDGRQLYAEAPLQEAEDLLKRNPNEVVRDQVLPQFGLMHGELWSELAARFAIWLDSLGVQHAEVIYDFSGDYLLVEQLLERLPSPPKVRLIPSNVSYLLDDVDGKIAADAAWHALKSDHGIGRHHALADAVALRARFKAVHRP